MAETKLAKHALRVKNWAKFQHYKGRRPPWIKLHRDLLDDYEFYRLPLASRALAPCIWLLASESDGGAIDAADDEIAFRLHCSAQDLRDALKPLIRAGFLIDDRDPASTALASCKQDATPETDTETDSEASSLRSEAGTAPLPSLGDKSPRSEATLPQPTPEAKPSDAPKAGSPAARPARAKRSLTVSALAGFDEFWAEYPRKVGKIDAAKAYAKALRGGVSPGKVLTKLREQNRSGALSRGEYTPYPASWLNAGRWDDEPTPRADDPETLAAAMTVEMERWRDESAVIAEQMVREEQRRREVLGGPPVLTLVSERVH